MWDYGLSHTSRSLSSYLPRLGNWVWPSFLYGMGDAGRRQLHSLRRFKP